MKAPSSLPVGQLALARLSASRALRWSPGLGQAPLHQEIFASGRDAGGAGVALALALDGLCGQMADPDDRRMLLWAQDREAVRLYGRPYLHGLPETLRHRLIHVLAETPRDLLFALEEGLHCRDLLCVIGEITGNPKAFDFTASRRLSLAAERHGMPLFLIRLDARHDLSSARMRWQAGSAPSLPHRWNPSAPGAPAWRAELFRSRLHAPGNWILCDDGQSLTAARSMQAAPPDHGDLAGAAGDRSLAAQ